MQKEIFEYDALGQAELVKLGKVSPAELVECAISRIKTLDQKLNSVVFTCFDQARARAKNVKTNGVFAGVPYLVKDLLPYKSVEYSRGSRLWSGRIADRTATPIARVEDAGAVVLGKSNTPEFGLMPTTESLLHGACLNPWDVRMSAGGSSGGAAAAVAAGIVPFAHATDGGGSIRMPASNCGVFGLKPSANRIAQSVEDDPHPLVMQLGVSRSVRDTAALLALTEVTNSIDLTPVGFVSRPVKKRRKIGVCVGSFTGSDPHPDVIDAVEGAAALCSDLGHELIRIPTPLNGTEFWTHFKILWGIYPALRLKEAEQLDLNPVEVLEPWTLGLAQHYLRQTPDQIEAAHKFVEQVKRKFSAVFETVDLMLSPVLADPPIPVGMFDQTEPFDSEWEKLQRNMPYTAQHNAAGTPAMSVPLGWSSAGLPIGCQFSAGVGGERMLLELAYELEQESPWADKWPTISKEVKHD